MIQLANYINGCYQKANHDKKIVVENPANYEIVGTVTESTREEAVLALEAAHNSQKKWAGLTAVQRAEYLFKLADKLDGKNEEFAIILTSEQGKPIQEARDEVSAASEFLKYAAQAATRIEGDIITSQIPDEQIWIQRVPYGVVSGLCAWNFPLALACRKIAGALVCGNTIVIKPPSETPLAVMKLGELCDEIGLPAGVLNLISGNATDVGNELVSNPITQLVTLTGSTRAGRQLYHAAAENVTVLRLELGGKAPFIVMEDADVDKAVKAAVEARFYNCGQICTCNERMYIHKSIYEDFKAKFVQQVKQLRVGDPMKDGTDMGPKVSRFEVDKLEQMVAKSVEQGGRLLVEGGRLKGGMYDKGNWFAPVVVEVDDNKNILMQEETFGPVVPMMPINDFEQAMEYANDCCYGLSSYLFTDNVKYIMRMINELEFGEVYVNRKNGELVNGFHNGFKLSGVGGEDGKYGIEGYLQKKTIYMNYSK